ncbi:DNA-binding transcriptional regulator, LysR family [Streptoalloteichus tenebrarius]|uniref:DNA-binding transcriptional regulator, LysR family n=1 Tax=Streptoalloteichus tenebrarius (strain ATCC 17920 / DSM 40477 / JCM 4838 / CBS 697.72 / NBRC 16177 / NCIMB 11028 / NRRL B-12390 / A12253. 1 / ISP 5477) TaxID=1933 RepID=A0ABT1HMA4_STRSD|nr:LysR family transcriptional regulator [Streptoalloteichus tenebrarius]MCP2256643.1 DNA-binding transcriptional regulator, LysR family [Streptoalloteichus tenebrarius]BFF04996.1 LysR substrate-binding domain-containing protein [Streptoalloteichus tenebrarius]
MDLLAHLEAYVAVAEEGSFSRAADLLYVAQPVLSRRIKNLERHLGGELFDRSRRQVTSTDLGVLLLPHAKDVLSRVDHLRQVARAALASAAHALGVPPDCDPAALARVIRAGAERGVTIGVRELPAEDRASGLADGSLVFALLRVAPETATHRVPLGLASAAPLTVGRRSVHLESLRPRRGGGTGTPPTILVTAEDETGFAAERFRKAAARAGLSEGRVRAVATAATAAAETLAGHAVLLCPEPFARRHGLEWSPLADSTLHRGYELAATTRRVGHGVDLVLDWMEPMLAEAIGAVDDPSPKSTGADGGARPDSDSRVEGRG